MKYGVKLKKYGKMMKGLASNKATAEKFAEKLEAKGIKAEVVPVQTNNKRKLKSVI